MMIDSQNIIAYELIGLEVNVVNSKDPTLKNFSGKIVYETMNTLHVRATDSETKMIPKKVIQLSVTLPANTKFVINGFDLHGRPEDRIHRLI